MAGRAIQKAALLHLRALSLQRRERLESPLQTRKNIKFPLTPEQFTESRLPVGTKGKCPPVRINPVVSAAFCLHGSWQ